MVEAIRSRVDSPVLVMTYWNPVLQYGPERFADALLNAGGAGLITPDITPDSAAPWIAISDRTGLDRVFLAAPTSTDVRLAETEFAHRHGFDAVRRQQLTHLDRFAGIVGRYHKLAGDSPMHVQSYVNATGGEISPSCRSRDRHLLQVH